MVNLMQFCFFILKIYVSDKNKMFLKDIAMSQMTQLGFYKNDVDGLKKFSNRHYLLLDFRDCPSSEKILYEVQLLLCLFKNTVIRIKTKTKIFVLCYMIFQVEIHYSLNYGSAKFQRKLQITLFYPITSLVGLGAKTRSVTKKTFIRKYFRVKSVRILIILQQKTFSKFIVYNSFKA